MKQIQRQAAVLRPSELPVAERGGGARTVPLVTAQLGSEKILNGITSFGPKAAIPLHCHNCEESVIVLEGHAMFEIDGKHYPLGPLDTTWIPPNMPHRFINSSDTEGLKIFWTYAAPDATRTLIETGVTHSIASEHPRSGGGDKHGH
jgi:quercetin dioxygenase-like cupin family protein